VLSSRVRQSSLGPLDRALGLVFGVARGVVIVCLGYLVMSHFLAPESRPNWIVQARSLKLLALGASQLQQLIPHSTIERGAAAATGAAQELDAAAKAGGAVVHAGEAMRSAADAMRDLEQPKPKPKPPAADGSGYRTEQQQEMNRAIQAIQGAE
jgi:membrane protein required for colicin V production